MTPETKEAFDGVEKLLHDIRADVDDLKGKSADFIDADRQEKMKAELAAKLDAEQKAREELQTRLDGIETAVNRPGGASTKSERDETYAKAFNDYMRKGAEADELKAMSTQVNADGGYMVEAQMEAGIRARLRRTSPVRAVANVVSRNASSSWSKRFATSLQAPIDKATSRMIPASSTASRNAAILIEITR